MNGVKIIEEPVVLVEKKPMVVVEKKPMVVVENRVNGVCFVVGKIDNGCGSGMVIKKMIENM